MLLFLLLATLVALSSAEENPLIRNKEIGNPTSKADEYRLPRSILPLDYTITLHPHLGNATFNGKCSFRFKALVVVNTIVLHSSGLVFEGDVKIYEESTNTQFLATLSESGDDKEFLTLALNGTLKVNDSYRIDFNSYVGILYDDNFGFYWGKYTNTNGQERLFATTQFESTGARRAFPCMDEPEFKTTFELSMIRDVGYLSTSNMPIFKSENVNGFQMDTYYKSLPMSTYLLAFMVSDFEYISDLQMEWIYARPEAIRNHEADYALSVSSKVLDGIADFTSIFYTGPKMEQITFPDAYFSAGAMENWGHVTYRDSLLLFDPEVSTSSNKQSILDTIAHEFGHQWFGNLATPMWWEYLWLSEGFATYLSYIGAHAGEPTWQLLEQFTVSSMHNALDRDSVTNTRPMNQEAGSPSDIDRLFDVIAYDKGSCIVRMMEGMMGTDNFRKGLANYLNEMAFQAAVPKDLYDGLAKEISFPTSLPTGYTLERVMNAWTNVGGYPLLTVKKYNSEEFYIEQQHFLTNGPATGTVWPIPINYAIQGQADFSDVRPVEWLLNGQGIFESHQNLDGRWFLVNKQQTGYYRVNYEVENWDNLNNQLVNDHNAIHYFNRAQMLDDSFTLARFGHLQFGVPLNMTRYMGNEAHYAPLMTFYKILTFLNKFMAREVNYKDFQDYIAVILQAQHARLGSQSPSNDLHMNKLNRINVLNWLAKDNFSNGNFRAYALSVVKLWLQGTTNIIPDLQAPYFCAAMATADVADWENMFARFQTEENSVIRSRILASLGCSSSNTIREEFLNRALDPVYSFSSQDILNAFRAVYRSGNDGVNYVYKYIVNNFIKVDQRTNVASLLDGVCSSFTTSTDLAMVVQDAASLGEVEGKFRSAIQRVQENLAWSSAYIATIADWFQQTGTNY